MREFDAIRTAFAAAAAALHEQKRERVLEQVAGSELRLRLAMEAGDLGSWEYDPATGAFTTSASCRENFGRDPDQPFAYDDLVAALHPEDRPKHAAAIREALTNRTDLHAEYRCIWPDRSEHWIRIGGRMRRDARGGFTLVGVSQDVTARKEAEERQGLLLHELNHRVKNMLATVQSVALLTRRSAEPGDTGVWEAILGRLQGLANTNDLPTATYWNGAFLEDVPRSELDPYQDPLRRPIRLRGPRVNLQPGAALALGLAVHELATNAVKYGSLACPDGRVHVMWAVTKGSDPASLLVEWVESGGPPVSPPKRQGFGSKLIQRGLSRQLGGDIKLSFAPAGVRCVITFPVRGAVADLDGQAEDESRERYAS